MRYYLDTNILIYLIKNRFPEMTKRFMQKNPKDIYVSSVVLGELEFGAQKSHDYETTITRYKDLLKSFTIVSFSAEASICYGAIRYQLEKTGTPIGMNDYLIAATAMAGGGTLVTHNTKEFERIQGLRVEDWTEASSDMSTE